MISFDDFKKALDRHRVVLSSRQINDILNDLLPNPQCGFSVGGVNVWGDKESIELVRRWQHDSVETVPALRRAFNMDDRYINIKVCIRNERPEDEKIALEQVVQAIDQFIDNGKARVSFASTELLP